MSDDLYKRAVEFFGPPPNSPITRPQPPLKQDLQTKGPMGYKTTRSPDKVVPRASAPYRTQDHYYVCTTTSPQQGGPDVTCTFSTLSFDKATAHARRRAHTVERVEWEVDTIPPWAK